jgi:NAD(P)-dependent dehydrogenase (short-subunit alcohol dehydrogenase family)
MTNGANKIALITGGSRGLGRAAAEHAARHGMDVIVTYRSGQKEAEQVVARIRASGRKAAALELDVGQVRTFERFASELTVVLKEQFGRSKFDSLVNNAGQGVYASFADTTEEDFDALLNVHFKGVFFLTQRLLPLIEDGGRILNVSTGLTRFSIPGYSAYAAMKGAIEVLTHYLAKELGERRIAVNTVAPGGVATDFGGGAVRDNPDVANYVASVTALGRVGQPDDLGALIAALISDDARWLNAQRIEASGGMFV